MISARAAVWVNAVLFQLMWLVAVGGAAHGWWYAGPVAVIIFGAWQFSRSAQPRADAFLVVCAMVLGGIADSVLAHTHLIAYAAPFPSAEFAPIWIVALWASFALALNYSLRWLRGRYVLAMIFGALGAPLSYWIAANTWHAVTLATPLTQTLLAIALMWMIVTPVLCFLAARFNAQQAALPALRSTARA